MIRAGGGLQPRESLYGVSVVPFGHIATCTAMLASSRGFESATTATTSTGRSGAPRDVTPLPDLLRGLSRAGTVRQRRPVYVDLLPPCNGGCPAGENIQAWLSHLSSIYGGNLPTTPWTTSASGRGLDELPVRGQRRNSDSACALRRTYSFWAG